MRNVSAGFVIVIGLIVYLFFGYLGRGLLSDMGFTVGGILIVAGVITGIYRKLNKPRVDEA